MTSSGQRGHGTKKEKKPRVDGRSRQHGMAQKDSAGPRCTVSQHGNKSKGTAKRKVKVQSSI